jgi:carbamoyl-phosphate synthase/aspartate carbamoyltransferase/dihydroorotase
VCENCKQKNYSTCPKQRVFWRYQRFVNREPFIGSLFLPVYGRMMKTLTLPGLIDPHVHMREPGGTHKEDWDSGTAAALAGGFTTILAMPNTIPPVTDSATLASTLAIAQSKARCDFGQYLGAGADNTTSVSAIAPHSAGLKMYLDQTYGPLRLDDMTDWMAHLQAWPKNMPVCAHCEGKTLAAVILLAELTKHPVHLCHVSRREEILLIKAAKQKGIPITCEVTPHHLFLSEEDIPAIGSGRSEVRPRLATRQDVQALWDNLDVIDCFATDHAPHTLAEKDSETPPPGFSGLETCIPLLLTAASQNRLSIDDIILRCHTNPQRIFNLPEQPETHVEIDLEDKYTIQAKDMFTRCGWTPYEGLQVQGRVKRVVLRDQVVYEIGKMLAIPGTGRNVRPPILNFTKS